jgi:chromate transporter
MVTQFVGFLAGWREAEPLAPLAGAIAAAALTTWVTFAPCFLWIFACAPWMDRLERSPALQGALAAITAAVVGVIANLALWFAGHVLFPTFDTSVPGWGFDWRTGLIAVIAGLLLFVFRRGILTTLAVCAASGLAIAYMPF